MSKSDSKNEAKLKASMEEFIGPLLKRIMGGKGPKEQETMEKLGRLVEATKGLVESRHNSESEFIRCFGAIERKIDNCECEENNQQEEESWAELTENLNKLLEKHGVDADLSPVSTNCSSDQDQEGTSVVPRESTIFEVGESSNSNNQVTAGPLQCITPGEYWISRLGDDERYCVDSLCIFPENAILKGRFLINWWKGVRYSEDDKYDSLLSRLVRWGVLQTVHPKKHKKIMDQWTINPTRYLHLKSMNIEWSQIGDTEILLYHGAILNKDQKYLSSKDLKDVLNVQSVQLGNWRCTDLKYHIEVDKTNFLKHLGKDIKYLSLRGISRIEEIPQSIGKQPHLTTLDLRACHNLEKLPEKPQSKLRKVHWFPTLRYLDVSECYLLDYMPYWICELYWLRVLKGFVVGSVKKKQSCRLHDLSRLKYLEKLSIRIVKNLDPKDASGLKSMRAKLLVLTVMWSINEKDNENDGGKVPMISFPKTLEKLDLRCYPEAEAVELDPAALSNLKRLYIRNGKLSKIEIGSGWKELEILRLRFLENLEMDGSELHAKFPKLKYLDHNGCPSLRNFPKSGSTYNMKEYMEHEGEIS